MRGFERSCWCRLYLATALLAVLGSGGTCWSQVVDVELHEEAEDNAAAQPGLRAWVMTDDQFDQWIFGGPRNSRAGRNKLDSLLTLQVDDVARMCTLSEAQKKKLLLAGRGDIKRFFDLVEEKRKKFDKVKQDQNKIGEIYQELVPLQAALNSGLFGDGSIYSKTIRNVLSEEDSVRYHKVIEDKIRFRFRAKVELAVAQLDQTVGFRDEQRRQTCGIDHSRDPAAHPFRAVRLLPRDVPSRQDCRVQAEAAVRSSAVGLAQSPVESNEGDGAILEEPGPSPSSQGGSSPTSTGLGRGVAGGCVRGSGGRRQQGATIRAWHQAQVVRKHRP